MQIFFTTILVIALLGVAWHFIQVSPENLLDFSLFKSIGDAFSTTTMGISGGNRVAPGVTGAESDIPIQENVSVQISSVSAGRYGGGSFVMLSVVGSAGATANITGWEVRTKYGTYIIPQVALQQAQYGTITLYDLKISDSDTVRIFFGVESPIGVGFWDGREPKLFAGGWHILNPHHDIIRLYDANGQLIDEYIY